MKFLGLFLVLLLGPPGWGTHSAQQAAGGSGMRAEIEALPAPAGIQLQLPSNQELEARYEKSPLTMVLTFGLTGFLVLLSLYFYRISIELGREAMRRERLARCFVQRNPKIANPPPVQGYDVDEIDSLLLQDSMLEAN
jgi:hypothetical protein